MEFSKNLGGSLWMNPTDLGDHLIFNPFAFLGKFLDNYIMDCNQIHLLH